MKKKSGNPRDCSLIFFDIDDFKEVNDTYGHLIGDHIIQHLADILTKRIHNSNDECFRYGGDEFAILLPETSLKEAKIIAENIRKTIENNPLNIMHQEIKVTISLGVSSFDKAEKIEDIIRRADDRLYKSKNKGKNRVS